MPSRRVHTGGAIVRLSISNTSDKLILPSDDDEEGWDKKIKDERL